MPQSMICDQDQYLSSNSVQILGANDTGTTVASRTLNDDARDAFIGRLDRILNQLLDWKVFPLDCEDDDVDPPVPVAVVHAIQHVYQMKDAAAHAPLHEVPVWAQPQGASIGAGGSIILEFGDQSAGCTLIYETNGKLTSMAFANNHCVA